MRTLVLGGTSFVGRAIAGDALRSGHEVTLFSRGRTGGELFPGVPRLTGDRDTGDRARGEPPLARGFTPAQEQALLAHYAPAGR